jgi:hypothetical protein
MKDSMYDYVFRHNKTKAKLSFEARSVQDAIIILSSMINTVADWDMKRYKQK